MFSKGSGLKGIKGLTPIVFDAHLEAGFLMNQIGRLDALFPQSLIDQMTEEFLKEKKMVKIQNEYFPILSPANLIIYLALHFFHHNYRGVFRLEFLEKFIRRSLKIPPPRRNAPHTIRGVLWAKYTPEMFFRLFKTIRKYKLQNFIYPVFLMLKKYYSLNLPKSFLVSIRPDDNSTRYIKKNILSVNIFDEETRIKAGVVRFKNILFLSSEPFIKKILIFLNPAVVYSTFWLLIQKLPKIKLLLRSDSELVKCLI